MTIDTNLSYTPNIVTGFYPKTFLAILATLGVEFLKKLANVTLTTLEKLTRIVVTWVRFLVYLVKLGTSVDRIRLGE